MFLSTRRRDLAVPRYLLDDRKLTFDINWRGNLGRTLVYWAARIKKIDFMEYLVEEKNADVNIADDKGATPLHHAAEIGNLKIVKYLVRRKAKITAEDRDGRKPVDVATDEATKDYLKMKMRNRGRRSIILQTERPLSLAPSTDLVGKAASNRFNSSLLYGFLMVATMIVMNVNESRYPRVIQRFPLLPQEIMRNKMSPFVIETIDVESYLPKNIRFQDSQNNLRHSVSDGLNSINE
jgi:hypothetical protein